MVWMLVGQGVVFAARILLAFRLLFSMRRRAVAASGRQFPGPGATLRSIRDEWRDRSSRRRLWLPFLGLTVLLLALTILWSQGMFDAIPV